MWNANLFDYGWRGTEGPLHSSRHCSSARPVYTENAAMVSLSTALGHRSLFLRSKSSLFSAAVVVLVAIPDVRLWPETEVPRRPRFGRDRVQSGHDDDTVIVSLLTQPV